MLANLEEFGAVGSCSMKLSYQMESLGKSRAETLLGFPEAFGGRSSPIYLT
jgi:hypothetical protein